MISKTRVQATKGNFHYGDGATTCLSWLGYRIYLCSRPDFLIAISEKKENLLLHKIQPFNEITTYVSYTLYTPQGFFGLDFGHAFFGNNKFRKYHVRDAKMLRYRGEI